MTSPGRTSRQTVSRWDRTPPASDGPRERRVSRTSTTSASSGPLKHSIRARRRGWRRACEKRNRRRSAFQYRRPIVRARLVDVRGAVGLGRIGGGEQGRQRIGATGADAVDLAQGRRVGGGQRGQRAGAVEQSS